MLMLASNLIMRAKIVLNINKTLKGRTFMFHSFNSATQVPISD